MPYLHSTQPLTITLTPDSTTTPTTNATPQTLLPPHSPAMLCASGEKLWDECKGFRASRVAWLSAAPAGSLQRNNRKEAQREQAASGSLGTRCAALQKVTHAAHSQFATGRTGSACLASPGCDPSLHRKRNGVNHSPCSGCSRRSKCRSSRSGRGAETHRGALSSGCGSSSRGCRRVAAGAGRRPPGAAKPGGMSRQGVRWCRQLLPL